MPTQKIGQFNESSYFDNVGGLNISDSVFKVRDDQSTGGTNFEYSQAGSIQKRMGHAKINTVANTELRSRGIDVFNTTLGTKTVVRAAGRKIQTFDLDSSVFTNLSQDLTASTTDVFPASTSTTTAFAPFNTSTVSLLNFAGGTDGIYSMYSTTKYTKNGAVPPSGTFTATTIAGGGAWTVTGTYKYGVTYLKTATNAESNTWGNPTVVATVTTDVAATVAAVTNSVVLTLSALTSVDTATYNRIQIYRSSVGGANGFTTGDLIATLTLPVVSYTDTGTYISTAQVIPRADSLVQDNSVLPTGTYNALTLWKRRLVTAYASTLRFSDLNTPESWPTVNEIVIPSGGPVTALASIAFTTINGNDEYLAVFKERELWLIIGNDYTDVTLSFIDSVGCPSQSLIAIANGFLSWIDYKGIYLWDGNGKPIYTSKPLDAMFDIDGDIDKSLLSYGCAAYFRNKGAIYFFLPSKTYGTNGMAIKMDLRLTLPAVQSNLIGRVIDGTFTVDSSSVLLFASKSFLPSSSKEEVLLLGDASGFIYSGYSVTADASAGIDFQYFTKFLDLGSPNITKRFHKVIVWVDTVGNWDLTLDYWAGYKAALPLKSTLNQPISTLKDNATALWDVAAWDVAFWDDASFRLSGLVYNLNNTDGNSEGDCIRLRLRNSGADQPVNISGYTVVWTEKALGK